MDNPVSFTRPDNDVAPSEDVLIIALPPGFVHCPACNSVLAFHQGEEDETSGPRPVYLPDLQETALLVQSAIHNGQAVNAIPLIDALCVKLGARSA